MIGDTDTPWEFTDKGLIVLPGIAWEKWETLYNIVSGLQRRSMFFLGDCLLAGEQAFGEHYAAVSGYSPETCRVALWVARKIEPARRRIPALSFSLHEAVAALDPAEQDDLLAKAESEGWRTTDMKAAVKERKEAAKAGYPNNGAPADEESVDTLAVEGAPETPSGEATEAEAETPADVASGTPLAPPAPAQPTPAQIAEHLADDSIRHRVQELRLCIEAVREVALDLALGTADPSAASALSMRVLKAMGRQLTSYSRIPLLSTEEAQALIPDEYTIKKSGGVAVNGVRQWAVELRGPAGELAVATGPHEPAAMIEVAIAAHIQAGSEPFAPSANGTAGFQFHGGGEPT